MVTVTGVAAVHEHIVISAVSMKINIECNLSNNKVTVYSYYTHVSTKTSNGNIIIIVHMCDYLKVANNYDVYKLFKLLNLSTQLVLANTCFHGNT